MRFFSLNQLPLYSEDFAFCSMDDFRSKDALVVVHPENAIILSPVFIRPQKSLDAHISFIQSNQIKKLRTIAEDISFLKQCPSIEYLQVFPSMTAECFDYSPIYELPNLKWLSCRMTYGPEEKQVASVDYSRLSKLKWLAVTGPEGHRNLALATTVSSLILEGGYPASKTLRGAFPAAALECLSITQAPIVSLDGIEEARGLQRLELSYNRRLTDISALGKLGDSLAYLEIDRCGKIADFSMLAQLRSLEFLILKGGNTLPDLSFLKELPKLKYLHLTMNVENGDIEVCRDIPYVRIQNRNHFSLKDKDMQKNFVDPNVAFPFNRVDT